MKKNLLLVASLFFGASTFAQFVESNAPAIGDESTLFIIDSLAPNLASGVGPGAIWDYSASLGYSGEQRTIKMFALASTGVDLNFSTSEAVQDLEGFLKSYSKNNSTERTTQGFVYNESNFGEIVVKFSSDVKTHEYPMSFSSAPIVQPYTGNVDLGTLPSATLTGILRAEVDGIGTLKLANNVYSNVLRYKIIDTINTVVQILPLPIPATPIEIVRVQYEYYDHSVSNLPIFVHSNVKAGQAGGAPMSNISFVLSKDQPAESLSVSANELANTSVYPNPADDNLNIQLPSSIATAKVVITDALGRQVYASTLNSEVKTIDVSALNKGMYFVNISNDVYSTTKNVVIK